VLYAYVHRNDEPLESDMFNPKFIITTDRRVFEVSAVNKFRAEDIAKARLQDGETITSIVRKHPK